MSGLLGKDARGRVKTVKKASGFASRLANQDKQIFFSPSHILSSGNLGQNGIMDTQQFEHQASILIFNWVQIFWKSDLLGLAHMLGSPKWENKYDANTCWAVTSSASFTQEFVFALPLIFLSLCQTIAEMHFCVQCYQHKLWPADGWVPCCRYAGGWRDHLVTAIIVWHFILLIAPI